LEAPLVESAVAEKLELRGNAVHDGSGMLTRSQLTNVRTDVPSCTFGSAHVFPGWVSPALSRSLYIDLLNL
jgi:hypothetical protein